MNWPFGRKAYLIKARARKRDSDRKAPMSTTTLVFGMLVTLGTASLLAYAGDYTRRRSVSPDARVPMAAFATWWYGASFAVLVGALHTAGGLLGLMSEPFQIGLGYARLVPIAVALWGLLYYITYLLTGDKRTLIPITAVQIGFLLYGFFTYSRLGPWYVEVTHWEVRPIGSGDAPVELLIFGILLAAPIILSAGAYGMLLVKMKEPTQRYRIGLIATAFGGWFGIIFIGFALGLTTSPLFGLFYQVPGLVASILVIYAYRPPAWVTARWGVEPVTLEGQSPA